MTEAADPLVLDFVEWIAREPRAYSDVIGAWKTSCPRLTIWEDAADRGYVTRETVRGFGLVVTVTADGKKLLRDSGRSARTARSRGPRRWCGGGEPAQAIRTQAIGAFDRHRQPYRLLRAPARACRIAAERGAAS